jgi:hypothetical protein
LDQAKQSITTSDQERLGHATAMVKLLDRMKSEGDPDYEKVRDKHMHEFASDRIKSSWVVDSHHAQPEHLKIIADKFPHMLERVAKNDNADPDTLRRVYDKSEPLKHSDDGSMTRWRIAQHQNIPKDLATKLASDISMRARSAAQYRLDQTMRPYPEE